ncbi:MAG TPA: signal peptidase I [Cytophagales bacterium]|nr:signal peptidase I [Cytophagales bacterium]
MVLEYLLLFFCTIPMTMLAAPGLSLLFAKAGYDSKKAYIPVVNQLTFLKITGKHPANIILEYIPVINIFSFVLDLIDFVRCYDRKSFWEQMATLFLYPIYFIIIGKKADVKYLGTLKEVEATQPRGKWYSSLLFAIVAATLIRWAFIEAYKIPTSSMEGNMLVNDFLFVSKIHYGPRTPETPLQVPLTHQRFPLLGFKSFSEAIKLPSFRFFGLSTIQRNKPLVFNWPHDTSVAHTDMKMFYVKRCVGIAGDTVTFKNAQLYINGKPVEDNDKVQYRYAFKVTENVVKDVTEEIDGNGRQIFVSRLRKEVIDEWGLVNNEDFHQDQTHFNIVYAHLSKSNIDRVKRSKFVDSTYFHKLVAGANDYPYGGEPIFPYYGNKVLDGSILGEYKFKWNVDHFGPLWLPKKGVTIAMNPDNVTLYANSIARYEGYDEGEVTVSNKKLYIKGQPQDQYTFKQNYYWLVGDNRHNSLDSRYWGFVPEDHVVGKPFITFFSYNKYATSPFTKIRWNRIFRFVE